MRTKYFSDEIGLTDVEVLSEYAAHTRLIIDAAMDAVVAMDAHGLVTGWNAQAEATFGWTREEALGKAMTELFIPQQYRDAHLRGLKHFLATGEGPVLNRRIEITALHREGREFPIELSITPFKVKGEWMFSAFLRDITERKKAEETLRDSEERFRLMVSNLKDYAILMLDAGGYISTWNAGAERFKGYRAEEIIGKHFSTFYPKEDVERGKPEYELKVAVAQGRFEDEGWRVRKDGSQFFANVVITALRDDSGELRGFAKVTRDITERKKAEELLRKSGEEARQFNAVLEQRVIERTAQLEEASRMKSDFLANMSHELRTPLNGIIGFSEFLVDEKAGKLMPRQKEYLTDILNSGQHLLQLINDVLDLSKVEAGRMELHPEVFSVARAVEEVCAVVAPMAQNKSLVIRRELDPAVDEVTLDPQKFKQVLLNLISNAVKFTDEGGTVDILAGPHDGSRLRLQVRDTGIGIKAEDIAKLFVEFQQLDSGVARRYQGTGLGLALTKKIVEFQQGAISIESEVGKGSTFTVVLPRASEEGAA